MTTPILAVGMRFTVTVYGLNTSGGSDLGAWSSCKGLQVNIKPVTFREPGNNFNEWLLYADVSYPTVKLERAVTAAGSTKLKSWLTTQLRTWLEPTTATRAGQTAVITLCDGAGRRVTSWTLRGVRPAGWTGPTLAADKSAVAIETLELAHEGFL